MSTDVTVSNARHEAAKRFAAASGRRTSRAEGSNIAGFLRALECYLATRDRFYPEDASLPINRQQCVAIYCTSGRRRTERTRAS